MKRQTLSNNAFQPTPPLRGGSLAALGAAERERWASRVRCVRQVTEFQTAERT